MRGCHETVAKQPNPHKLLARRARSRQYGGSGRHLELPVRGLVCIGVASRTASDPVLDLGCSFEVAPGVEGEHPESSAARARAREHAARRRVLRAAGREEPAPGLLREGHPRAAGLCEEEGFGDNRGTEAGVS